MGRTTKDAREDAFFDALAHPCRREIIRMLHGEEMSAGEIAQHFDMAQATVSRHLSILTNAGIVSAKNYKTNRIFSLTERYKKVMMYSIDGLLMVKEWLQWEG